MKNAYNHFEGRFLVVKPQHSRDTDCIKWANGNSYSLVLDKRGPWIDANEEHVACYSFNGCGEIRWDMTLTSNARGEDEIIKKFGLVWVGYRF